MKIHNLLLGAAICFSLTSCFKDEPLNAECDIEQAYVHVDDPTSVFFSVSDTLVNVRSDATEIVFEIKADTLRFEPAHERYNKLLQLHPEILKRAPLVYVASLLQMTPETLSRVRSASLNS